MTKHSLVSSRVPCLILGCSLLGEVWTFPDLRFSPLGDGKSRPEGCHSFPSYRKFVMQTAFASQKLIAVPRVFKK